MLISVSWLFTGFLLYTAVRKYRRGRRLGRVILWFCWTQVWVGVLAVLASEPLGPLAGLVVYLAYALWQLNALSVVASADEFFTSQYGRLIWHTVRYLGGHPEFRDSGVKGVLLVSQSGVVLVEKYRENARTLLTIPIDRITTADAVGLSDRTVAWAPGMPVPMTFSSNRGTLVVQFLNDLNGPSTASFDVGCFEMAGYLKNQVDYTIYDWQRSIVTPGAQGT